MRALLLSLLIAFVLMLSFANAAEVAGHVQVVQPVSQLLTEGGEVDLGVVGPGQKIEIEISRTSNIFDYRGVEEVWDRLKIDDSTLPQSDVSPLYLWTSEYSLKYEANPKAFVVTDSETPDGEYNFKMHTEWDYNLAAQNPVSFNVKAKVTKDVLGVEVLTKNVQAGVNQPAEFLLKITNKGSANDAFNIEVVDGSIPGKWTFKKQVFVPHNSEKEVQYELIASEQTDSNVIFKVTSLSSDSITAQDSGFLSTRANLLQDMRSVGNGVILFPFIEQVVYYLLGFVANNLIPA